VIFKALTVEEKDVDLWWDAWSARYNPKRY
jgi:hypothetical protein